jgi:hypothetical protein
MTPTTRATEIVDLAVGAEFFHTPDREPFADFEVDGHREVWPVGSREAKLWLSALYWANTNQAPSRNSLQDALATLEAKALFAGSCEPVAVRLAQADDAIYLDLANDSWEAVEITAAGWRVVREAPVRFRRTRGMLPLPRPTSGGGVADLAGFINAATTTDFRLAVSWVIGALRPRGPYPILALHGEQGSAKSTTSRVLRALVDPNVSPVRAEPREARDLMIAARNSWILGFDNLSRLAPWLSDALCRLATGGGFATRELYTDTNETIFEAQRPIVLNGIADVGTRSDFLDRTLVLYLPPVDDGHRRDEESFWHDFEAARPSLLGALLDAVSAALSNQGSVQMGALPRMADFARWIMAAEVGLGWEPGSFLAAYQSNRETANTLALEGSALTAPLLALADAGGFEGTATTLLERLRAAAPEESVRQRSWPGSARALSDRLRRLAPNLRTAGLEVEFWREPGGRRSRMVRISARRLDENVPTVPSVADAGRRDGWDGRDEGDAK